MNGTMRTLQIGLLAGAVSLAACEAQKMLRNMKKLAEGGTLTPGDKQAPVDF
jgi:hypothetical protein